MAAVPAAAPPTLLLTRADIAALMDFAGYLSAVEAAFRALGEGERPALGLLHLDAPEGEFHVKAGGGLRDIPHFAFKINGGFYQNAARRQLPNIMGLILLCDGHTGLPLALLESGEITRQRTAAAAALAVRHLAPADAATLTLCGCGALGRAVLPAVAAMLPQLAQVFVYDQDAGRQRELQQDGARALRCPVRAAPSRRAALGQSQVVVTCTPAREPFVRADDIAPGTMIAAMGADSPEKQELEPRLLACSTVVVDRLEQCAAVGELHHAIAAGLMAPSQVAAELGAVVAGRHPGRRAASETIVFDATGTAVQDVAAAAEIYRRALAAGVGAPFAFLA